MTRSATATTSQAEHRRQVVNTTSSASTGPVLYSPQSSLLSLQRTIGNKAVGQIIQMKLTVSDPGDRNEREADKVADRVMRMTSSAEVCPVATAPDLASFSHGPLQRRGEGSEESLRRKPVCDDCEEKLQRSAHDKATPMGAGESGGHAVPSSLAAGINAARGGGQPLPLIARAFFEPRLGFDFSSVRIHASGGAESLARGINARAFTVGHDIFFGTHQYSPETPAGKRLMAHELTHVIQQQSAAPTIARAPGDQESATLGTALEASEIADWKVSLERQGYEVFARTEFEKVDWLKKAFSDKRARPDLVAINRSTKKILVGDITAGPGSTADIKPGDLRKLPNEIGGEIETKAHLEKTIDNARQLSRNRPPELADFEVSARDRYWKQGGYSREIVVTSAKAKPSGTGGKSPTGSSSGSKGAKPKAPAPAPAPTTPVRPVPGAGGVRQSAEEITAAARAIAREAGQSLKTELRLLRATRVLTTAVRIVQLLGALKTLDDFVNMTMNSLSGKGFILTKEIAAAEALEREAEKLAASYPSFSDSIQEKWNLFMKVASDPLSAGKVSRNLSDLGTQLELIEGPLSDRIVRIERAEKEADDKHRIAISILEDPKASAAIAMATLGTAELAMLFAASEDMERISGTLGRASSALRKVHGLMRSDIDFIKSWEDALFDACERGGACSTKILPIIEDVRILPPPD